MKSVCRVWGEQSLVERFVEEVKMEDEKCRVCYSQTSVSMFLFVILQGTDSTNVRSSVYSL